MKISVNKTDKMLKGFFKACTAVEATLGAEGRLAIIEDDFVPFVTKDGVTVAKHLFSEDRQENLGMFFAKQAALKTLAASGDSTSTTLVFAKALAKANKNYFNSRVKSGIEKGIVETIEQLKNLAKWTTDDDLFNVAKVSANNNEDIAQVVFEAYKAVGKDGIIDVEQNENSTVTSYAVSSGLKFNKGWKSPFFINNQKSLSWENSDVRVVLYEGIVSVHNINDIAKGLTPIKDKPILLMCDRIEMDAENIMVDTFRSGKLNICIIEAPHFADERSMFFKDMAMYTGGEVFQQGLSTEYKFGTADKVIIEQNTTSIVQKQINQTTLDYCEDLQDAKRKAVLLGKAAIIKVGAVTGIEGGEVFDRVEDSVAAVKSAVEEGVIAGGGSALVYIANKMTTVFDDEDEQKGYNSVKKALYSPFKAILKNAKTEHKQFKPQIEASYGVGYNVKSRQIENLIEKGILDSSKSIRIALENAKSVVSLLLDTSVIVSK